ncbi:hypothetical protein UPYG_G00023240 [Umbra pygmaea]|uniref:Receptor activity-modifying protein 1 n=1 Tax=Umbra pygmaea TaxID=75934 RepID=A0ABD0XPB7_UMBPY
MGLYTSQTKLILVLFVSAHSFSSVSGCNGAYERAISDYCVTKFSQDMDTLERSLWCSWPDTLPPYRELTNCTLFLALKMDCFWPNRLIDELFTRLHQAYFYNCTLNGRLLHDPPMHILGPFIALPVLVTLLMAALVVCRSKHSEGII